MITTLRNLDTELDKINLTTYDIINSLTLKDVEYFLTSLGVDQIVVNQEREYIICPTICHNPLHETASMKLYWYHDHKIFRCYTECNEAMSIFRLYQKFCALNFNRKITDLEAKEYVLSCIKHDIIHVEYDENEYTLDLDKYKYTNNIPELPEYPAETINYFTKYYHPSWLADGILPQVMDKFNIRFSIGQNKIIIPHYDINGRLIGIRGRALEPAEVENYGKYRPVQIGKTMYSHQLQFNLYGIYEHKEAIKKRRVAVIAEAEKSVLLDDGYYGEWSNCIACCGSNINKYHISLLTNQLGVNEIIIALDKEYTESYDEKGKAYRHKLEDICKKYSTQASFSYIWDYENLLEEKDSPFDKGQDIYEYLLKNRVKVR